MISYIGFSQLSANEMVALWNKGFEGYFFNATMELDRFLARTVSEGLSLEHSLAIAVNGEPVGFIMNGFRMLDGKKTVWNGGTGIAKDFRGKGYGKLLLERTIEMYREQGAERALLEAIVQNEPAIKLYQGAGYKITGQLIGAMNESALDASLLLPSFPHRFTIRHVKPMELRKLPYYDCLSAWQTQWQSHKDDECCMISDGAEQVGFALYKRIYSEDGKLNSIALYQCEAAPGRADKSKILKALLREVYGPLEAACKRVTLNLRSTNDELHELLDRLGFKPYVEQVHMELKL
ncbi:GNAT family N-acetyltransferase [Paenibacillus montanisoli]|uniref:GNAT family N-acetyltransferase n=1 Tax=Paenibacillus montanisoli TaxID=2081970 RepID=A0A328U1W9_9BACL|nr:GNAT family N-acetyltransferase [Paenibacillus montanisoli]RAP76052.1 GNAT family N-acetyltransferase [Paenibacillus montanisoli]